MASETEKSYLALQSQAKVKGTPFELTFAQYEQAVKRRVCSTCEQMPTSALRNQLSLKQPSLGYRKDNLAVNCEVCTKLQWMVAKGWIPGRTMELWWNRLLRAAGGGTEEE